MQRGDERRASYKKKKDSGRGETLLSIRKAKKDGVLAKRRRASDDPRGMTESHRSAVDDLPKLVKVIQTHGGNERLAAVRCIRRMVTKEGELPAKAIIDSGMLPLLATLLSLEIAPELQHEVAWTFTNVAAGDSELTQAVANAGATPGLVRLLDCQNPILVREQAAWAIANIAGDGPSLRDHVLRCGAVPKLIQNARHPTTTDTLLKNVMWTLTNLCKGMPSPELDQVKECIPTTTFVMSRPHNVEIFADCLWALSYLSGGGESYIQAVLEGQTLPFVMKATQSMEKDLLRPALQVLGNIVTGNTAQTQVVLDAGILSLSYALLHQPKQWIRKGVARMLYNIAASDSPEQVATLFDGTNLEIVRRMVDLSLNSEWDVRKEAIFFVSRLLRDGTSQQVQNLVDMNALESMCEALVLRDNALVLAALLAIEKALKIGEQENKTYIVDVDECDGKEKLEAAQLHSDPTIYEKAITILETFFRLEDDEVCDENLKPSSVDGAFKFGYSPSKDMFRGLSTQSFASPQATPEESRNTPQAQSRGEFHNPM